jgi:hypothetical protein
MSNRAAARGPSIVAKATATLFAKLIKTNPKNLWAGGSGSLLGG